MPHVIQNNKKVQEIMEITSHETDQNNKRETFFNPSYTKPFRTHTLYQGGKFLLQIPRGAWGMVMDEIDTCIIFNLFNAPGLKKEFIMSKQFDLSMLKIVKYN